MQLTESTDSGPPGSAVDSERCILFKLVRCLSKALPKVYKCSALTLEFLTPAEQLLTFDVFQIVVQHYTHCQKISFQPVVFQLYSDFSKVVNLESIQTWVSCCFRAVGNCCKQGIQKNTIFAMVTLLKTLHCSDNN